MEYVTCPATSDNFSMIASDVLFATKKALKEQYTQHAPNMVFPMLCEREKLCPKKQSIKKD